MREGCVVEVEMGCRSMICERVSDGEGRSLFVEGCWTMREFTVVDGERGLPIDDLWRGDGWGES